MNRILFFLKVPPPVTGAILMNLYITRSKKLREKYEISEILISYVNSVKEIGKLDIRKLAKTIRVSVKLIQKLYKEKPDFVYFQISPHGMAFLRDCIYISLIKFFKIKILYHLHGKGIKEQAKKRWKKNLYIYAFKGADIICLSNLLVYDIEDVFSGNIYIVPNGIPYVDRKYFNQIKKKNNINILFLSNLIKSKGVIDFIKALQLLNKKGYLFKANIVGDEKDITENDLKKLINKYGLEEKIFFLGPKFGEEKYKILDQCDLLVFPTKNDIWGNVILEAMQFSKPVIATIEGAIPEIVDDGVTGFLVDKNAPEQITEKLEILINNPYLRKSMGRAARKKYEEKYTLEKFEMNMLNVFQKIITNLNGGNSV